MNITPSMNCTRFFRQAEIIVVEIGRVYGARLFTKDMLAGLRRPHDPFPAQGGRQRKVNGVHIFDASNSS